ncbi:MAG: hypothetical protein J6386_21355 [Candidatus Synoicihabitans palmerolidicus]|nr:hypothetical protein [Candidatus Synoicihabitans palmerolidicus]
MLSVIVRAVPQLQLFGREAWQAEGGAGVASLGRLVLYALEYAIIYLGLATWVLKRRAL